MTAKGIGALTVLLTLGMAGCTTHTNGSRDAVEKDYEIKGRVVALADDRRSVVLDHEDIPGLMKAMKMNFRVLDPKMLDGLSPGDRVRGRLKAADGDYILTRLEKR